MRGCLGGMRQRDYYFLGWGGGIWGDGGIGRMWGSAGRIGGVWGWIGISGGERTGKGINWGNGDLIGGYFNWGDVYFFY